ncbi:MAG: exonuclease domain-containing protein [Oscillospiraceae bacterium]|nr:exonuclease domain-containing protein [Oscillospiraceae bacterium]
MSNLIFLDLEWNTTFYRNRKGERLPFHELIEVAAMKVEEGSGAILDSFHSYVHPKASRKIESRTYRLLPYEPAELRELLADAPGFLDLGPAFLHWCGPSPVFVEWGSNDVGVLLSNFEFHHLSLDADWTCEYFDLQYMYQKLCSGELGQQPSLEKAVTELALDTGLDFHSAWNDTYYTVLVYLTMLERVEGLQLFHRPPKRRGPIPLWEAELGSHETRWACKNRREVARPCCPICGQPLVTGRWVRTAPTEQVQRCRCQEHRRLYMAVTAQQEGQQWMGRAAIYKDAGPVAERYRKACRKGRKKRRESPAAPMEQESAIA